LFYGAAFAVTETAHQTLSELVAFVEIAAEDLLDVNLTDILHEPDHDPGPASFFPKAPRWACLVLGALGARVWP
jgi:hypothetical protein